MISKLNESDDACSNQISCEHRRFLGSMSNVGVISAELMILGFISLLLTFGQSYIAKICIPTSVAETMLPCDKKSTTSTETDDRRRRLLWHERRSLAAGSYASNCTSVSACVAV